MLKRGGLAPAVFACACGSAPVSCQSSVFPPCSRLPTMAQPSNAAPLSLLQVLGRRLSAAPGTMSDLLPGPGFILRPPGLVYLITGGSGFLGQHLVRLLLEKEDQLMQVRVFDQRPDPSLSDLSTGKTSRAGSSRPTSTSGRLLASSLGSLCWCCLRCVTEETVRCSCWGKCCCSRVMIFCHAIVILVLNIFIIVFIIGDYLFETLVFEKL